jgi:hypothetical protein
VTAALVRAIWELALPPHLIGKINGIGSRQDDRLLRERCAGFQRRPGRMPPVATGANAANRGSRMWASRATATRSPSAWPLVPRHPPQCEIVYVIKNNGV